MKISYNWLKTYIDTDLSAEKMAEILTDTGLEVEGLEKVETIKGGLEGVVIGKVLTKEKHPDADRLNITTVDVGNDEPLQIVCGAPNVDIDQHVVVATVGTTLYPSPDEAFKIKKSKIRGVESFGMICAEDELGLGQSHDGIMVLEDKPSIGMQANQYFEIEDDYLIEIGLTPNRADAMGHIGVARDLKAYLNFHEKAQLNVKVPDVELNPAGKSDVNITVKDTDGAPRYAGAVITGLTVKESPDWLQNRLRTIGLSPINNLVDITNFVLHETGCPLHAFDLKKVEGNIIVRRAQKGEKLITLDEVERELQEDDLMICNSREPMCIAGVFGGLDSGVQSTTDAIFLEAAYFNPVSVRKTAKRHGLNTDSSFRFERGVDPNFVLSARDRAVSLILEIAGGELIELSDQYPNPITENEVVLNLDRCRRLCGVDFANEDIANILEELDIKIVSDSEEELVLKIPTYRVDVTREADVIEEILRIYGFNQVPVPDKLNASLTFQQKPNRDKIYNIAADLLVNNGFHEIMNNSLTSSANWDQIKSDVFQPEHDVQLLNPLSNELDVLRQTMIFGGLKSIVHNQNRQAPDLKLFELGNCYRKDEKGYQQSANLSIWLTGAKNAENWTDSNESNTFYNLKGIVDGILNKLGINKNPMIVELSNDLFEDGYQIKIANKAIAEIGWIKPEICKAFGVKSQVYYAEFDWDQVIAASVMNKINFQPLPKTQFVRRDFSLLLNKSVQFSKIASIARKADKKILKEVGLFDVYEGKNLPEGKKSYAVSFIFQDQEKTLKDKQIDAIMDKIRKDLEGKLSAELR
ncbi:MAG: phenylalanine--tRNA ligase subunit beta [Crocinitomicaceae bacterium]